MNHATHLSTPLIALALGADLLLGDPTWLPHPVRLIGAAIASGERGLRTGDARRDRRNGRLLALGVIGLTAIVAYFAISVIDRVSPFLGALAAVALAWTTLAMRGLDDSALAVERALSVNDLVAARTALPALVGRDPDPLGREGIARATVESVAENSSDAVIAPMLFLFIAGPVGAIAYKAANTLDSMIGYRDERYLNFGRAAARIDDIANYIPARLSALCIAGAASLLYNTGREALRMCSRDAYRHASINAGYPEAAMAGALGVQLGGAATYAGEIEERAILGDAINPIDTQTIQNSRKILRYATFIAFLAIALGRWIVG